MQEVKFEAADNPKALAQTWRKLEAVSQGGFFRGWTYLGTLLPHLAAPHVLSVRENGEDIALGLFSARGVWPARRLSLHEAGNQPWDGIFVEHNGLLVRPGAQDGIAQALAKAARRGAVTLSGIDAAHLQAARQAGSVTLHATRHAPAIDLVALAEAGRPYLDTLSANARAQIRRAMRLYGADLAIGQARDVAEAHLYFDRLAALHQASWTARGKPGAFAQASIRAFHARLIEAALPRAEAALLRVTAAGRDIGYLYQLQHGGRVMNYQAGLVTEADARLKPGLVCHMLAIEHARAAGAAVYDFLAGAQRYKATLVPRGHAVGQDLHWATLHRRHSMRARLAKLVQAARLRQNVHPPSRHDGGSGGTGSVAPASTWSPPRWNTPPAR